MICSVVKKVLQYWSQSVTKSVDYTNVDYETSNVDVIPTSLTTFDFTTLDNVETIMTQMTQRTTTPKPATTPRPATTPKPATTYATSKTEPRSVKPASAIPDRTNGYLFFRMLTG